MNLKLHIPNQAILGKINLPGSKSISNRILIIKALSGINFSIQNLSDSDDTTHLQEALENYSNGLSINVGHAGTDMRFLTTFLALQNGGFELTGSERIQQRPMKDLVDVLRILGADITYKNNEGFPPLQIIGKQLNGGKVEISGKVSSQFITALLLVAPYFSNGLELTIKDELVSKPYVNMTIELMKEFGAQVIWVDNQINVFSIPYSYNKLNFVVESDWSAASYYYSFVALSEAGTTLTLSKLFINSLQADIICDSIYKDFGVTTKYLDNEVLITKLNTKITDELKYDFVNCPDITQTIVCTCIGLNVSFKFTGLQTLKVKETDRILALQNELKKFGCLIETTDDSIQWANTKTLESHTLSIATYNDHRMAMSFAPLCLLYENIIIENAEVVSKSYPLFWKHLKQIGINQTQL